MGVADGRAVAAAVAAARAHGLRVDEPVVLRDRLNVLVWLKPAPVVARVAGTIAAVRPGDEWLRREVAVADSLAAAGAPVVAPSAPSCRRARITRTGGWLSFWAHVPAREGPIDPVAAGEALRACHAALRSFAGSLPLLGVITEAEALLARLAAEGTLAPDDARRAPAALRRGPCRRWRTLRAPVQPLHGDAHLGNVLNGPDGPLWNDWEDTCLGPVGWDAACLVAPPGYGRGPGGAGGGAGRHGDRARPRRARAVGRGADAAGARVGAPTSRASTRSAAPRWSRGSRRRG